MIGETGDPPTQAGIPVQCRYGKLKYYILRQVRLPIILCSPEQDIVFKQPKFCSSRIFLLYMSKNLKILILIFLILISIISVFFILKNKSKIEITDTPNSPLPDLPLTKGEEKGGGLK